HTRWATHGRPTEVNAHPHIDCSGRIFAVHNGIIENFAELRTELAGQGHEFISDTDSEVIPHLVESLPHESVEELVLAVRLALGRLEGTYALALCSLDHPGLLIGARRNAPLVVGLAEGEWFLASDITAVIGHTKRVMPLGEGQMVVIDSNGPTITSIADGTILTANEIEVDWDVSQAEKAGFPHFMLKEIGEAPEAVANALRGRLDRSGSVQLDDILEEGGVIDRIDQVLLLGMGTSLHAAMVGEHVIEAWAGIPARAQDASEFRYRRPLVGPRTLVVVITQSGETADTLMAMRLAKECGSMTIAVTNVVGSTVAREADGTIFLHSGPEIGVASTKTFLAHLISQFLLALRLAELRNGIPVRQRREIATALLGLPEQLATVLAIEGRIAALARQYAGYPDFMYIGRGLGYPIALEGALKLKEISYLHAEGISAGDLKHGPIALLDSAFPVVALCTESAVAAKMVSNVHEIVARDAPVLALVSTGDPALLGIATDLLEMPPLDEVSMAILNSVALQLFAYHVAAALGLPIDQPRNLAKSVTVE
ncbi:MAG TPA: glutamine--fructose-6-phosphate transaminase (isomerizing), partial [Candidatus Dormibacteraeota bacterium]|nr:glutamine--fructose-6-phosphate transaminase (isomerizing) [Candidatus Dormibacteraeota bacterium]